MKNDLLKGESLREFLSEYSSSEIAINSTNKYSPRSRWDKYNKVLKHALKSEKTFIISYKIL